MESSVERFGLQITEMVHKPTRWAEASGIAYGALVQLLPGEDSWRQQQLTVTVELEMMEK